MPAMDGGCRINPSRAVRAGVSVVVVTATGADRVAMPVTGKRRAPRDAAGRPPAVPQGVMAARRWWWSLRMLWVAAIIRHSLRTAVRPRRWKRLIARLNLICPKTGSMVIWGWGEGWGRGGGGGGGGVEGASG